MNKSAGIIPFRDRLTAEGNPTNELEFFVGSPWQSSNYAAFLKGSVEEGESIDDTALREFREESGLTLEDCESQMLIPLGWVHQNSQKMVFAYGLHYPNIDPDKCFSNLCPSGKPEIVKYAWMTYDELKDITSRPHLQFYQKLIKMSGYSFEEEQEDDDIEVVDNRIIIKNLV